MSNFFRSISFYLLIIILILSLVQWYSNQETAQVRIGYSELIQLIDKNEVAKIKIVENSINGIKRRSRVHQLSGFNYFYGKNTNLPKKKR